MEPTILSDYRRVATFQPRRFSPVPIGGTERFKAVLTCFEPGQFIPVHRPPIDMTLVILEGEGQMVAGEQEVPLAPGTIVIVPAGEARGVKASTRLVAIHLVTPPPGEGHHAEVQAGLERGEWR